ncbi:methyltransferase domain-containing protein [Halomonas denitrificans]|nr:methyltransferase domain-containing protein [Halomonas denitrificans]
MTEASDLELLVDLHLERSRQGPGSRAATRRAIELAGLRDRTGLEIADLGCGTGASTLELAALRDARVTAVDLAGEFLVRLQRRAQDAGTSDRVATVRASIDALPLVDARFDAVWSEGAIYTIGFADGLRAWRRQLKPGGVLAVSEITWTTCSRPSAIEQFWSNAYPDIGTASSKMKALEEAGYSPIGYFTLPPDCWLDEYYQPLEASFDAFLERHRGRPEAARLVEAERREIALYRRYGTYYSYGMYIARRPREETVDDCRR